MINIEGILVGLVRLGMGWSSMDRELVGIINSMTNEDWDSLITLSCKQGVNAICADGIECLMNEKKRGNDFLKDLLIPKYALHQFIAQSVNITHNYKQKTQVLDKLALMFDDAAIPLLVLKGITLNRWYPKPEHRPFGDIDIYLGENYEKGNAVLKANGAVTEGLYYRHSELLFHNTMIENHCWLSDKGVEGDDRFEHLLRNYALQSLNEYHHNNPVIPNSNFNALFVSWHASATFMFEDIQLRHILDWAMFLINESKDMDLDMFRNAKKRYKFGKFSDIMTAIAVDYLHIPTDTIPPVLIEDSHSIDANLTQRTFYYILESKVRKHYHNNTLLERLELLKFSWQDKWKYKSIYNTSFFRLMLGKVLSIITNNQKG